MMWGENVDWGVVSPHYQFNPENGLDKPPIKSKTFKRERKDSSFWPSFTSNIVGCAIRLIMQLKYIKKVKEITR